ncbi:glycosyl hydrolase family 8 [Leptothoe sp. LEGE 181152]|uniref:Glycosyl hydrolase n=1 Tax=Adonisia turfae CCMR0081 TaxID=2292702 RepID=A0A6M0RLX1_9CYAN|nr:glycosyl hydrolase family 8 [Adonisia turfae]MDV3352924.1 glycosyl hydrolase family 8 [Leptothoe sp. LEGE 181152]NEZ57254.1 glycosyl hydrolase [Adonisia turfae CCMR0081]
MLSRAVFKWMQRWGCLVLLGLVLNVWITGCLVSVRSQAIYNLPTQLPASITIATSDGAAQQSFFETTWQRYRDRFIQADGRVIDWENDDQRTTSEGQAYAMLRALLIDDPETFDRVLQWGEENLARLDEDGELLDHLWAWKWGPDAAPGEAQTWGILDENFATDADIDAATALIMAARRWKKPAYLTLAKIKLKDIWDFSTADIALKDDLSGHYLLPGPMEAFHPSPETWYLNPSYAAPYAFRLFAQVDRRRDWMELVHTSYRMLEESAKISELGLPSDWFLLHSEAPHYRKLPASAPLRSIYGFDAYRVWWRVALDLTWFEAPPAGHYLSEHLTPLLELWQQSQKLPAQIDLAGEAMVDYGATSQYAMVYQAARHLDPKAAEAIRENKLALADPNDFWDGDSAYYTQNLAWLGLYPPEWVPESWFRSVR